MATKKRRDIKLKLLKNLASIKLFLVVILFLFFPILCLGQINEKTSSADIFEEIERKWEEINTYTCQLFSWSYRTEWFIKNWPERVYAPEQLKKVKEKKAEPAKPDWVYRGYSIKFKKPDKFLFTYDFSGHEHTDEGGLIDRAIAYVLRYVPGTTLNYGFKDKKIVYVKFPYITFKELNKMDIPLIWKAPMQVLMIASHNEIYKELPYRLIDPRGLRIEDLALINVLKKYEPFLKRGKSSVKKSIKYNKDDYDYDEKTGWLVLNDKKPEFQKRKEELLKIIITPSDNEKEEKYKGISKIEIFVDATIPMLVGIHEWEFNKLACVIQVSTFDLNVNLPDSLWEEFFKGRNISNTGFKE